MDIVSLKKYIFENNKIEFILNEIGCHSITYHSNKDFFSCANYDGDNSGAINVKNNEYLNVINWTREKDFNDNSDIITLVQYNKNLSFKEAVDKSQNQFETVQECLKECSTELGEIDDLIYVRKMKAARNQLEKLLTKLRDCETEANKLKENT